MCGKCCIHREDILLNSYDLYRIAKALDKEPQEIFSEYCEAYLGQSSKMVLVRLIPRGSAKRCPFLRDLKCSIHKYKPTVCALYPLGRSLKVLNQEKASVLEAEVRYIYQKPSCGDTSETHTVREWLSDSGFLENEEFFKTWMQLVSDLGKTIRTMEDSWSANVIDAFADTVLGNIYLNYSTDEPFMPQYLKNDKEYRTAISELLRQFDIPNNLNT